MPYCSLEEAWAPVNYPKSDVYGKEGNTIYPEQCSEEPKPVQKSFSRSNERLAKHSGPVNRLPNYKNQVVKYNSENKQRYMGEPDLNNDDTPITSYDKNFYEKNDNPIVPIHTVTMKKPKVDVSRHKKKKDMDSIDKIIAEVEDSSVNDSDNEEPFDVNSTYKDLSKEHDDKNDIIKHLIGQNEKLKAMIKKMDKKPTTSGVFNIWDFIIVLLLGVIMLVILDYICRIVIKKSMN